MSDGPRVGILVGSESDRERMQDATALLDEAGVGYEFEVRSAHRTPDAVAEYARGARDRGLRVLICGAGLSAALPGAVAAQTDLPVIGVPLRSSLSVLDGLDALLAIAQMPPGVPVATVGVDSAVERAVVEERVPVHRRAEAVEELPRLAELPIPGGLGVVGGCSLDVGPEPAPVQLAPELVRLARPVDAGRVRTRHGRVVVARPARELDGRRRALRETADVGARVAEHRGRDLVVRREAAGEED